jgi:hypothetical protein
MDLINVSESLKTIDKVEDFNYYKIKYPLDILLQPATGSVFRYGIGFMRFGKALKSSYIWLFPFETLLFKEGICIDTANLVTSLLRILDVDVFTVLGEVHNSKTNEFLGLHAWTEYGDTVIETTIHEGQGDRKNVELNKEEAYSGKLKLKYVPFIKYNETVTMKKKGYPLRLLIFGKDGYYVDLSHFRKLEKKKQFLIWNK